MAKDIFIGSSTERQSTAEVIAKSLTDLGYNPICWWHSINPGDITFTRLREISRKADGAVFIFGADDETWYRDTLVSSARDNVILEFGMFAQSLDTSRVLIVRDCDVKIPTDAAGITYIPMESDVSAAALVAKTFARVFNHISIVPQPQSIELSVDPLLARLHFNHIEIRQKHWHSRALYLGSEGSRNWLALSCEHSYRHEWSSLKASHALFQLLHKVRNVRTFVSLGPGDGHLDKEIAMELTQSDPQLQYIPIDLSDALLMRVVEMMAAHVHVPVGILADFEERFNFVRYQLSKYATTPTLFGMMGNTLGNLDMGERCFLRNIYQAMSVGDWLLLDVSTIGPNWEVANDRANNPASLGENNKKFLIGGVRTQLGADPDDLLRSFDSRVISAPGNTSDIPETQIFVFRDTTSDTVITTVRRYRLRALSTYLVQLGFDIAGSWEAHADVGIGVGLLLVRKGNDGNLSS